ncbi:MAG TPA: 4-demethylwyosine synthase TYW1 [Candidatus Nanoarchaeia archaeon]|nr:4-demethylwyosine synthase TYW1 [Candidatus Nanoarchaeia archaeon]
MLSQAKRRDLEKQGYRLVGEHSAIKACLWTKKSLLGQGECYKQKFYAINSHRCVQMTPSLPFCTLRCTWCWRDIEHTLPKWAGKTDPPKRIIAECIREHVKYLQGFGGNKKTNKEKYAEAHKPMHFAISLAGEPTLYPQLPEMIRELRRQKITSFLVTNGTSPEMLKTLKNKNSLPTQLYITLPAPNEEVFSQVCSPLIKDGWKKILESLKIMKDLKKKTRTTIRLTVAKGINMSFAEQYAKLIRIAEPMFVEVKAFMHVGYSKKRLEISAMPIHSEIKEFAGQIAKHTRYKIVDEQPISRVVLLMKRDSKKRKIRF